MSVLRITAWKGGVVVAAASLLVACGDSDGGSSASSGGGSDSTGVGVDSSSVAADGSGAGDGTGGSTSSTGAGAGSVVCPGVAYTRTDDPGTALCIDGADSFECGWGSGNPDVDGYVLKGEHDASAQTLTLYIPRDPTNTAFDPFVFDMYYDVGGVDLVLEYMANRAGDYAEVGSWAEAAAGDLGVCGGDAVQGGGEGSCRLACGSDAQCDAGQLCLESDSGRICLAAECTTCFDEIRTCFADDACVFTECGPQDPDFSDTCKQPCDVESGGPCNEGEVCTITGEGSVCLPPECQTQCFDGGTSCYAADGTCEFLGCE